MKCNNNGFLSVLFRDILGEDPTLSGLDSSMNDELEEVDDVEDAWSQKEEEVEGAWSQKEADLEVGSGQSAPMEATLLYQARMARLFLDIMYWDIVEGNYLISSRSSLFASIPIG